MKREVLIPTFEHQTPRGSISDGQLRGFCRTFSRLVVLIANDGLAVFLELPDSFRDIRVPYLIAPSGIKEVQCKK